MQVPNIKEGIVVQNVVKPLSRRRDPSCIGHSQTQHNGKSMQQHPIVEISIKNLVAESSVALDQCAVCTFFDDEDRDLEPLQAFLKL